MLALSTLAWLGLAAGVCAAQPVVVLDAAHDRYVLDAAIEVLEDPARTLWIDGVAGSDAFVPNAGGVPNRGYSNAAYWVRFRLRDAAPGRRWLLVLDNPNVSLVELLVDVPGADAARLVYKTGSRRPFGERPVSHTSFVLPLDLPPGADVTAYLHLVFEEPVRIPLRVWAADAFHAQDRRAQFVLGAFYGVLFIMALYHLLLFASIRDRSYLYFALFAVSLGVLRLGSDGLAYAYLWPQAVEWNQQSKGLLNGLTMLLALLFARRFLDTPRSTPRVDLVLRGLAVLSGLLVYFKLLIFLEEAGAWREVHARAAAALAVAVVLGLFAGRRRLRWGYHPAPDLWVPLAFFGLAFFFDLFADAYTPAFDRSVNTVVSLGALVCIGAAGLRAWRQGFPPAALFVGGMAGFLAGGLVDVFTHVGLLPYTPVTRWSMEVGLVAALGLLSLSQGDRINLLRRRAAEAEQRAQAAGRRAAEARFEALQAKINPHFLFNVLNAVAGLIRLEPVRAERAVEKLSRLFRYTLHRTGRGLVPLPEELEMVRAYLELEKIRLEERLDYAIRAEGDLARVRVPALVVQPLVENSIKHAVAARASGGRIEVDVVVEGGRCRIAVRDDGPGLSRDPSGDPSAVPSGSGYGLVSIRERLALVYGEAFEMTIREAGGVAVEMVLPAAAEAPQPA